ncbi:Major facilitator superfamily multidrug-resistance DHA1 sub-family [Mycena sanguinolenta]|uniref:Major facilitator superfamily multidrug-resistance DHA1 sub-family n=1 Tax=Mycena sanguinolenta TaxID=230812 RepID=A0A8H7DK39_9AGAR|nr:Major facilitator superfamily multidrug-resistance DHA1 sub-family [Mycena sanguinolenta]
MSPRDQDETTPLLAAQNDCNDLHDLHAKRTPLPLFQFSIVLFLQLAEPLTSNVIYPFAPQLMRDIGITEGDETKVGYYVGIMQSIFFLTQAMTVLHWSRISDRLGRKPIILTGLLGLSISMFCFGLSRTFWGPRREPKSKWRVEREHWSNKKYRRRTDRLDKYSPGMRYPTSVSRHSDVLFIKAYAFMPISWSTGSTLGPIIGGSLARPADRFPDLFGDNQFLRKYPYFLPCAVPATFSLVAWAVTFLFLEETAVGPSVLSIPPLFRRKGDIDTAKREFVVEDGTPALERIEEPVPPLRALLIPPVIVAAGNYALLSLVDISLRAIHPVFLSTPIELGGLGMSTSRIGNILSIFGILNGFVQVFFFRRIHDYMGSKKTFILGIASALPTFAAFPFLNYLARAQGMNMLVWTAALLHIIVSIGLSFSYGAVFIYISAAAPSRSALGATNGLSQLSVSIMRAIGPATANSLYSLSMEKQYMRGYMYCYVLIAVTCVALWVGSLLPRRPGA